MVKTKTFIASNRRIGSITPHGQPVLLVAKAIKPIAFVVTYYVQAPKNECITSRNLLPAQEK